MNSQRPWIRIIESDNADGRLREIYDETLKAAGLSDEEILDITQITAYFNFVNRMVLGLGVELESSDGRQGFKY